MDSAVQTVPSVGRAVLAGALAGVELVACEPSPAFVPSLTEQATRSSAVSAATRSLERALVTFVTSGRLLQSSWSLVTVTASSPGSDSGTADRGSLQRSAPHTEQH